MGELPYGHPTQAGNQRGSLMAKAKRSTTRRFKQRWYVTLDPFEVCIQKTRPRAVCRVEEATSFAEAREKALEFLYDLALDCAKRAGCIRMAHTYSQYQRLCHEKL